MIRNLKALGLALVAVFALGAVAASSASATDHVTLAEPTAVVTGLNHFHVFKVTKANGLAISEIKCTTSKFAGTVTNNATSMTIYPTYTGTINQTSGEHTHCTATGGATKATIDMNECDYDLTGETTGSDGVGTVDATISITCPETSPGSGKFKEIEVTTNAGCTLQIPPQTPTSGGVTYTNEGTNKILITATSTGITFTSTGALCGLGEIPSEGNNSDYNGTVLGECFKDVAKINNDTFTEGAAVNCSVS